MSESGDMGPTGNAQLLLGYIAGALLHVDDPQYRIVEVQAAAGTQTVEHRLSGNTYRIAVVQLSGSEWSAVELPPTMPFETAAEVSGSPRAVEGAPATAGASAWGAA